MMKLNQTKNRALVASAVLAVTAMSLATSADARPRHSKQRHQVAQAATPKVDDRYALVLKEGGKAAPQRAATRTKARKTSHKASHKAARRAASSAAFAFGSSALVAQARAYIGTNPTGRSNLWCARFLNMVLERSGRKGTGSDMASSFASYGRRISGPQVGAIAVMSRGRRGGHVGIVSGIDESGNPIIISGNHNDTVAEAAYPRGRIYAYVMPN
jgi:uncharacterized protein (TIGR02594 family)